jgi:hypothetical protein
MMFPGIYGIYRIHVVSCGKYITIPMYHHDIPIVTWGWVKTLYPCSSHQNSWDLWMFIPLKMVCIGIDP